ncbi:MAG: M48 family metalloprotease [SAR86 cluster bacterium]
MKYLKLLISFSLLSLIISCSVNPVTGERDFVLMSEDAELEMGRKYYSQILQSQALYQDPKIQSYVQSIGDSLAELSHRSDLIYRFTVLDSPDVNAFALPGGYIFINRGLMVYLSSEEELAAVLGHEIGHVTARHSVRQISQAQVLSIISYAVAREAGSAAGDLTNIASGALVAGYGRDMELQADSLGAEYMAKQGYSALGMIDTISVLKEHELYSTEVSKRRGSNQQTYHGIFASHPSNDSRLKEVIKKADSLRKDSLESNSLNYLKRIEGMTYGDSQVAGILRKNGFYHKDLDIRLISPDNWEVLNTPNSLIFIAPEGKASLQVSVSDQVRKETPKNYLSRLTSGEVYQSKELKLGGHQAFLTLLEENFRISRVAIVFKNKRIFTFYGTTEKNGLDIGEFDNQFLSIIESFRDLKATEIELTEPLLIKSYKVARGDSYSSLARKSPIPFDPESRLRLLNGDYPDGDLEVDAWIKIVE